MDQSVKLKRQQHFLTQKSSDLNQLTKTHKQERTVLYTSVKKIYKGGKEVRTIFFNQVFFFR